MINKIAGIISRLLLGLVFIFSGFVKAVDPLGSAYKFSDYFEAFGLGFLDFSVLPLSIFLSVFELVLGIVLIMGYRRRATYVALLLFMSFFTFLTLILAVFNPVSDCGCFGDALILTNWQTFLKNVLIMFFVLILFFKRKGDAAGGNAPGEWIVIGLVFGAAFLFSYWNFRHLPMKDFRPYSVGTVISEAMEVPEGAPVDEYETILTYRNLETGSTEDFTVKDYPKDTTLWVFEKSESKLLSKGYEPPIHDFALMDEYGDDLTDRILTDPAYSLFMISYNLEKAEEEALTFANEWAALEKMAGDYSFYAITASTSKVQEELSKNLELDYAFLVADEIMLKTMLRSNPGFLLLKNGTIVGKWSWRDFPGLSELDPELSESQEAALGQMDEETRLLMEAGLYEDFSFNTHSMEELTPELLYTSFLKEREKGLSIIFIMSIFLTLLLARYVSPIRD